MNQADSKPAPRVSVLMSVYNGEPYVSETIASIRVQTFTDWEFVIVDNASTDGTFNLLWEAAQVDPRIVLRRSPLNLGHSGGLNEGLAACRGEWVARIDADDIALSNRLERQLAFLEANPDVGVASCLAHYINAQGERVGQTAHDLTTRDAFERYLRSNLAIGILHPGAIIKRELLNAVGGYRSAYDPANDIDLWGRLADVGALILVQTEYLMEYRVHGSAISANDFEANRLKYQWARDSMRARRRGEPEPPWEEYVAARAHAPLPKRLNRWRKTQARRLYRQGGQDFASGRRMRAAFEVGASLLLQPFYGLPRLREQVRK